MKNLIVACLLITFAISCNKMEDDQNLVLIEIANNTLSGSEDIKADNYVFENESDWNDFLSEINSVNSTSDTFTETDIDFDNFIVVACVDAVRSSGGYWIKATAIKSYEKSVEITVEKTVPNGGFVTMAITQPYYIAKIKKTDKKIIFN